jgi:hypothetical protein
MWDYYFRKKLEIHLCSKLHEMIYLSIEISEEGKYTAGRG